MGCGLSSRSIQDSVITARSISIGRAESESSDLPNSPGITSLHSDNHYCSEGENYSHRKLQSANTVLILDVGSPHHNNNNNTYCKDTVVIGEKKLLLQELEGPEEDSENELEEPKKAINTTAGQAKDDPTTHISIMDSVSSSMITMDSHDDSVFMHDSQFLLLAEKNPPLQRQVSIGVLALDDTSTQLEPSVTAAGETGSTQLEPSVTAAGETGSTQLEPSVTAAGETESREEEVEEGVLSCAISNAVPAAVNEPEEL